MFGLTGKRVLVTGASSGIGAAAAAAFAQQGAHVALHYGHNTQGAQSVAADIEAKGWQVALIQADFQQRGAAHAAVDRAAETLGGLDVLINNAGSRIRPTLFLDADDAFIDGIFDTNVRSIVETCQAAIPHLRKQSGGSIINIGSIAGAIGGGPDSGLYGSAKAFVHNLSRHLARTLGAEAIRVNTVSPGVIDTPFHAATAAEEMEEMRGSIPLQRIGTPAECVGVLLFLASNNMSGYITGQNIHVNGGQFLT